MDKHEDIKATSALAATSGNPAVPAGLPPAAPGLPPAGQLRAGEPRASEPTVDSKAELAPIDSPPLAPTAVEMTAKTIPASSGVDALEIEPPRTAKRFEEIGPDPANAAPASRDIILLAARPRARASRKISKFTWLAASLVLAAAFGATAGVLGATALARLASEAAPAAPPATLQTAITDLRSEVAALKAGVDTTSHNTSAQYTRLVERFDRAERAQAATKSDAAFPKETIKEAIKETTGSVTLPASAAVTPLTPAPVQPSGTPQSGIVPGWAVRDVYRGVAMLQSRMGGMVAVEAGDVLPSLGRIEAIRHQDGRWVVITSKGMITSMR